jgi:hypothetical protein
MWRVDILGGYHKPPLSLNKRMHWALQSRLRQQLFNDTLLSVRAAKLPRGLDRVSVEFHYVPATKRRQRDEDNLAPNLKACCDALVVYGLVPDDSNEYLTSGSRIDPINRTNPGLYLLIADLSVVSSVVLPQDEKSSK